MVATWNAAWYCEASCLRNVNQGPVARSGGFFPIRLALRRLSGWRRMKIGSFRCRRLLKPKVPGRLLTKFSLVSERQRRPPAGEVAVLCAEGRMQEALDALSLMDQRGMIVSVDTYCSVLQACMQRKALDEAKRVHSLILKNGLELDTQIGNTIVNMFVKCGSMSDALEVFERLPHRTTVGWTAIMSGYVNDGQSQKALGLFHKMLDAGARPNRFTFITVIKACGSIGDAEEGKQIHARVVRSGFGLDVFVGTSLVDMYAKCRNMTDARQVFDELPERDVVLWNAMIAGYAQNGQGEAAWELYCKMQREGMNPNCRTFACVLKACSVLAEVKTPDRQQLALEKVRSVQAKAEKSGCGTDLFIANSLIHVYAKLNSLVDARQAFDTLPRRNVVSWTAIIAGYAQREEGKEALQLYDQMLKQGVKPDNWTVVSALNACGSMAASEQELLVDNQLIKADSLQKGKDVHAEIIRSGFEGDVFVGTALVDMYAKCGSMVVARHIFDMLPRRNVVSWNAMIAGYAQQDSGAKALELYAKMEAEGVEPDNWTFVSLLKACGGIASGEQESTDKEEVVKAGCLVHGKKLHAEVIRRGFEGNIFIGNTLIDMYANCGSMVDARHVFDNLPQRNVVSWNAIIAGYAEQDEGAKALDLYDQMRKEGMPPNNRTFVGLIQACANLATFEAYKPEMELKAKQLHEDVALWGFESDTFVGNSLIHLYAKWGRTRDAREVFDKLSQRDVVSWNTMIVGYAEQDQCEMAIQLYAQMQEVGVRPDEATFQCILKACSTLGALQLCRQVDSIIVDSGLDCVPSLAPTLIHAYGKCGSMGDALRVFQKLPKHDLVAWNALIGGYSRQGEWKPTLQYFEAMQLERVKPDEITFLAVFAACSHAGMVDKGLHYYESMVKDHGISVTRNHFASLIDLLGRAGLLADAERLLLATPVQPDLSTWTALLGACRTYNNVEVATRAFKRAIELEPHDTGAYVLMSSIYASAGMWEDERKVRELRMSTGTWKKPGRSWIEDKDKVHVFLVGDKNHQQSASIYAKLKELTKQMEVFAISSAEGAVQVTA